MNDIYDWDYLDTLAEVETVKGLGADLYFCGEEEVTF